MKGSHGPSAAATDWRTAAECAAMDPDIFFPIGTAGPALRDASRALSVCRRCPVTAACLDWALRSRQEFGVWGGTTEEERELLLRGRRSWQP